MIIKLSNYNLILFLDTDEILNKSILKKIDFYSKCKNSPKKYYSFLLGRFPIYKKKIIKLIESADIFFCESPFLADEEARGQERCHLTSRQAGTLAREACVKQLNVFHFSRKHMPHRQRFYNEAEMAFKGNIDTLASSS